MARMVVTTIGSSGDLHPFIALGLGLRARGHDVLFAVEDRMRPSLEALGFAIARLSGDGKTALAPYARQMFGALNPFASVRVIVRHYILPTLPAKIEELRLACEGADLLVSAAVLIAAGAVADLAGMPWASVALSPVTMPSEALEPQPPLFPIPARLQRFYNRTGWLAGNAVVRHMVDGPVNQIRRRFGLPPRRDVLQWGNLSTALTAAAFSPAFVPRPPDWPPYVRQTGFCFWDTPGDWREPAELTRFLGADGPVVAVSTGSMAPELGEAFARFYRTSLEAVRQAGARALVIGADPVVLPDPLPAGVYALPYAPFSSVYPRCAAAIHHGGVGTTAQSLRAGLPALIVPWGADQYFDGARVQRLGAGLWMQRRFYTTRRATRALEALLREPHYTASAQAIAAPIAREDGVAALCDALEGVCAIIRELGEADAEIYWALRLRALREHPDAFGTAYEEVRDRPIEATRQNLREHAEDADRFILGAFDDSGTLIGMVRLGRETGLKDHHKATLTSMYVAREARGQGVGKALMRELIARAQALPGLEHILLAVTGPNTAARELYRAFGFTVYGTEPHALKLPDGTYLDEDLMILWLGEGP